MAALPFVLAVANCVKKLVRSSDPRVSLGNLATFRDAALAVTHGTDIYRSGVGQYVYPPLIAFLYQPLGCVSIRGAGALMLGANAAAGMVTLWLLSKALVAALSPQPTRVGVARVAAMAAMLSVDHIRTEFNQWETNIFVLLMFALALRWNWRHPALAGVALGFAFNIKYLPIVLVPLLVLRRRWTVLGSFASSIVLFALLPGLSMGWKDNLIATAHAYGGLGRLLGGTANPGAAPLLPFTSLRSISVPSAVGRMSGWDETRCMGVAAMLAAIVLAGWASLPSSRWGEQRYLPSEEWVLTERGRFALEWVGTILLALIFSPYTNSGHLYLLLAVNVVAAIFLLKHPPGVPRWPLRAGVIILLLGTLLPPGLVAFRGADLEWRRIGGVGWCMLAFCCSFLYSGVTLIRNDRRAVECL